jgi:hypothetical protein
VCQSRSAETPEANENKTNYENGSKNNFAVVIDESRSEHYIEGGQVPFRSLQCKLVAGF